MATVLSVMKKTPLHCTVKISGDSSAQTIVLASTLLWGTREVAATPKVNIMGLHWSIPGATAATIVRNSVTIYSLIGSWSDVYNGFSDNQENTGDIVVTMPAGGGHVILELLKVSGYGNTQHLNQAENN